MNNQQTHLQRAKEEARENFETVFVLLDKVDEYILNSDYDTGLSSRYLTEKKLDEIITSTCLQVIEDRDKEWLEAVDVTSDDAVYINFTKLQSLKPTKN